jgi:hypothetical protein
MWNAKKSVLLSLVFTRIVMVLVLGVTALAPKMVSAYLDYTSKDPEGSVLLLGTIYVCCVLALVALFSLDRLLTNIKRSDVFLDGNVRYLRRLSWCCFLAAFILLPAAFSARSLFVVAVAAGFIGLILRVVKNVIEEAVILKSENDLTI